MIHGKGSGLEIVFAGRSFEPAFDELSSRLKEGPEFYRGTRATVIFGATPSTGQIERLKGALGAVGMAWEGAHGEGELEALLAPLAVPYLGARPHPAVAPLPARERRVRQVALSESARSLVADFAGARSDLAERRVRGVRARPEPPPVGATSEAAIAAQPSPTVLYHRGPLRGGQSLANVGHIVVVGDVNPGAELVAGGDIVVFGRLSGVAHAGAQGERSARVYALVLAPTQLRIATTIAAGSDERAATPVPEEAFLDGERIAIIPAAAAPNYVAEGGARSERAR